MSYRSYRLFEAMLFRCVWEQRSLASDLTCISHLTSALDFRWKKMNSIEKSWNVEHIGRTFTIMLCQFENAWLCVLHLVLWDWQMLLVSSCNSRTCVLVWELSTNRQPLHCHLFGLLASPLPVAVRPFFRLLLPPSGHKRWIFETDFHNSIQMYSVFSTAIRHRNFAVAMNLARRVLGWDSLSIVAGL